MARLRNHGLEPGPEGPQFVEPGLNYRLPEIAAALGLGQLERFEASVAHRRGLAARYRARLANIPGIRLPSGTEYRGKLRQHPSTDVDGEHWYEGYIRAEMKDHVTADTTLRDRFNKDSARPSYFHPQSKIEPVRIKLAWLGVE